MVVISFRPSAWWWAKAEAFCLAVEVVLKGERSFEHTLIPRHASRSKSLWRLQFWNVFSCLGVPLTVRWSFPTGSLCQVGFTRDLSVWTMCIIRPHWFWLTGNLSWNPLFRLLVTLLPNFWHFSCRFRGWTLKTWDVQPFEPSYLKSKEASSNTCYSKPARALVGHATCLLPLIHFRIATASIQRRC